MLTIAGIQMACGPDRDENLTKALDLAGIAAERGARILCFAECFAWPWFPRKAAEANRNLAEPIPGPVTRALQLWPSRDGRLW
jgi:N-carbamoylputrescine amidase